VLKSVITGRGVVLALAGLAVFLYCLLPLAGLAADQSAVEETPEQAESTIADERRFFVIANLENTMAHEMGHVLLDEFDIPVLGNMEVAADQIALFLFSSLMGGNDNFVQGKLDILSAIADEMRLEWGSLAESEREKYWSLHPFEPQRFYSMVCMIYGSDPRALEHIREYAQIPYSRAFYCRDEFETAHQAVNWVLTLAGRRTAYTGLDQDRKITVSYEKPVTKHGDEIRGWVESSGVIESMVAKAEEMFQFKRPINITLANCQYPDAMWMTGKGEIVLCYQLLERYYYLADHRHATDTKEVLNMEAWNAFCMHESVAEHYSSYCTRARK
jgi:hypothetical protein